MKIRFISTFVCLALLLTLLSGCVNMDKINGSSSEIPSKGEDISGESSAIDSSGESLPAVESNPTDEPIEPPEIEEVDFFTKHGHGNLPEPIEIPDYYTATDTKYLYKRELHLPAAEGFSALVSNGILLFFYWNEDVQYCDMVSFETGKLIKTISVDYDCQWGQFKNGGFWLADQSNLEVKFYDTQGNETLMKEGKEIYNERYPNALHVTDDGKYFITGYPRGARIEIYNLETGEVIKPTTPLNLNPWEIYELSKGIYFGSSDGSGYLYNIETGESQVINTDWPIGYFYGDVCELMVDGYINLATVFGDEEQVYVPSDINSHLQDLAYGVAAISSSFTNNIMFSDLRKGVSVEIAASEDAYGLFADILDNGTALILEFADKGNFVYIYDLASALRDENETTESEALVLTNEEIQHLIDETAEDVYAETGVELIYGSEGNDFDIYDYVGVPALDLYEIYNAVNVVKGVLDMYPDGMLREAYSETNKGLKFYLCGNIYGVQQGGIDTAGGVTSDINGYIAVILDINESLWSVIPHELSHAFDNRIQHISDNGETDWMAIWEAATPFETAYTYSYDEYIDNNDFTVYGEENPENVWFTEDYARTFPTEDRACIMENLFMAEFGLGVVDISEYENLLNKAKLYCYILRQCFPSCNTETSNYWETKLGVIDSSVVPEMSTPVPMG